MHFLLVLWIAHSWSPAAMLGGSPDEPTWRGHVAMLYVSVRPTAQLLTQPTANINCQTGDLQMILAPSHWITSSCQIVQLGSQMS